jgi:hypothetical protein
MTRNQLGLGSWIVFVAVLGHGMASHVQADGPERREAPARRLEKYYYWAFAN